MTTKFQSFRLTLTTGVQSGFRNFRLRLGALTRLSPQSVLLQLVAVGSAAVMVGLIIVGIQTVVQDLAADPVAPQPVAATPPEPAQPPGWAGLPLVPAAAPPAQKTAQKSASGQKPAQTPAANSASRPSALAEASAASNGKPAAAPAKTGPKAAPVRPAASAQPEPVPSAVLTQAAQFTPPQEFAPADSTNFGDRYAKDIFGKPVQNSPLIVLHETVGSADSAINLFRTRHTDESLQASYHSIIRQDGTVVFIVSSDKRAFGAGNSVFNGPNGPEAVRTHQEFPPSVNNFSYHISLETPPDGDNNAQTHSGYSDAQYRSLAWLIAHTSVPDDRITTHRDVDQSGSRIDPRSFESAKLFSYLRSLPRPYLQPAAS